MFDLWSRLSDFPIGSPEHLELMNLEMSLEEAEDEFADAEARAKMEEEARRKEYEDQRKIAEYEWIASNRAFSLQESENDIFCGKRVLVVEGNKTNYLALSALINHTGVMLDFANNVAEALEKYCMYSDDYDMILLDADMPEIDVYDAACRIKSYYRSSGEIPIITMTDNVSPGELEYYRAIGMDSCLHKPMEAEAVIAKMQEYLTKRAG